MSLTISQGQAGGSDAEAQNWESGVELTVSGCTFCKSGAFSNCGCTVSLTKLTSVRNFAATYGGAVGITDVWPFVVTLENNTFIHNEAMFGQHMWNRWNGVKSQLAPGSESRPGSSSLTETNS